MLTKASLTFVATSLKVYDNSIPTSFITVQLRPISDTSEQGRLRPRLSRENHGTYFFTLSLCATEMAATLCILIFLFFLPTCFVLVPHWSSEVSSRSRW